MGKRRNRKNRSGYDSQDFTSHHNQNRRRSQNKQHHLPESFIKSITSNGTVFWKMSEDGLSDKH